MSKDYYKILGVSKSATKDEIKKAFRKAAQKHHPDKGGDEKKFKEVGEAYAVLSDDQKRAQYDQFGTADFNGQGFGGFDFSNFDFGNFGGNNGAEFDLGDIFNQFFGGGFRRQKKGANIQVDVDLTFKESVLGAKKKLSFFKNRSDKKTELEIEIPAGVDNNQIVKLRGKGEPIEDGIPGDLYVHIHVQNHETIQKRGIHLVQPLEISISEAILGTKKEVETIESKKTIKIPAGSNTGDMLRIKGEGIQVSDYRRGDMLIGLKVNIPNKVSKKVKKLLEELNKEGL
jgi:curved DNA-binding protein